MSESETIEHTELMPDRSTASQINWWTVQIVTTLMLVALGAAAIGAQLWPLELVALGLFWRYRREADQLGTGVSSVENMEETNA